MSLKKLLSTPVETRDIEIEHEGMTFIVRGRPDGTIITKHALDKSTLDKLHRHCEAGLKRKIDPSSFSQMLLVQECLVNTDAEGDNARYDVLEIARLALEHGPLYLAVLHATLDVLGLAQFKGDDEESTDPVADSALGN